MSLSMTIRLALKNIIGNRLRSGLTILGLVIGIASVILLVGMVNGATQSINEDISSMGADVITVSVYEEGVIQYEDMDDIRKLDLVSDVSPYVYIDATISKGGDKSTGSSIYAAGEAYTDIMGYEI